MLAPVLVWNLSSSPSKPKSLTIDGLEVGATPGSNTYGVNPGTIHVKEAGPGQVSSLEFVITDPQGQITLAPGMFVRFDDRTLNLPIFVGWVEEWSSERLGVGRRITVSCIGVEAWLDWTYVPAFTIATGTELNAAFMAVLAAASGVGLPVRWAADTAGFDLSTVATPVGFGTTGAVCTFDVAIPGGSTRQALQALGDAISAMSAVTTIVWAFTIDFYLGARVWTWSGDGGFTISDYGQPQLRTTGAFPRPSNTKYGVNGSGAPRLAYVKGSGLGTGYVSDGSGIPGPVAVVSNPNSTTADRRNGIGLSYLASRGISASGEVTAEGGITLGTFGAQNRAGTFMVVVDPQAGLATVAPLFVQSIDKSYAPSGEETWTFAFGATVPRAAAYLRALTSGQLI